METRHSKIIERQKTRGRQLIRRAKKHIKTDHSLYWYVQTKQKNIDPNSEDL